MISPFRIARRWLKTRGFTLIELMVVVAVVSIILVLAAPPLHNMILMQRLRGATAQLVTDMQFARNEAVGRGILLRVSFRTSTDMTMTCYSLFTAPGNTPLGGNETRCNCLLGPGSACTGALTEVRTVQTPIVQSITLSPPTGQAKAFAFDPTTGGIYSIPTDDVSLPLDDFIIETYIDDTRKLHTKLNRAGRPTVCAPAGSTVSETICPSP